MLAVSSPFCYCFFESFDLCVALSTSALRTIVITLTNRKKATRPNNRNMVSLRLLFSNIFLILFFSVVIVATWYQMSATIATIDFFSFCGNI